MEVAMHRQPPTTKLCKLTFTNLGHNHNSQDVEEEHPQWSLGAPGSIVTLHKRLFWSLKAHSFKAYSSSLIWRGYWIGNSENNI